MEQLDLEKNSDFLPSQIENHVLFIMANYM